MVKVYDPKKIEEKPHGPYLILELQVDRMVQIQRAPHVKEKFNLREIFPYKDV